MVLDPLSALAVGATVVQFIEFSSKLISKAAELYKGSSKALIEVQELHNVSQRLARLNDDLLTSRRSLRLTNKQKTLPPPEEALEHVSLECTQIAAEFEATLKELLVSSEKKAWKSCRQAFKSIWNKNGLETMQRRLGQQREQLVIHLLVVISNTQLESLGELRNENKRLETHILDAVTASNNDLKDDLAGFAATLNQTGRQSVSDVVKQNWKHWQELHKDELLSVFADISSRIETEKEKQISDYLLSTLQFPQLRDRELGIHPAHAKTFGWIFERSGQQKPFSDFVKWVESPSTVGQVYWVAGKPGSGKSTLMRFLARDDRTKALFTTLSPTKPLLFASWFFWLAGTDLQKSYHGLIRSLLYDLLRQAHSLLPELFPWRWTMCELKDDRKLPDWTIVELEDALHNFLQATADSYRLALFIDGLDELQGDFHDHSKLVELMKRISQFTHIKFCVSSRPWPVFQSAFSKGPMLRLENLTHEDISRYVHDKFSECHEFQSLQDTEINLCSALVEEIVDKAQGVFLWVYLVVRSLLQGVIEGDTRDELYLRLRKMPEDLDDFFRYIVMGIQHDHRSEAAALFKVVLEVPSPTVLSLSFLNRAHQDCEFWRNLEKSTQEALTSQISTTARRIESRGKGLLEVLKEDDEVDEGNEGDEDDEDNEDGEGDMSSRVDFLHRTARDFLLGPSSQAVLGDYYPKAFRPNLFICRAIVAQLQTWGSTMSLKRLRILGNAFCRNFRNYEEGSNITDVQLMDYFTIIVNRKIGERQPALSKGEHEVTGSSVFLALWEGIKLYALYKIEHDVFDLNARYSHFLSSSDPSSFLNLCAGAPFALGMLEAAAALLKRGAKVNDALTVFLVEAMKHRKRMGTKALGPAWAEMAKLLIQHGAPIKAYRDPGYADLVDCRPRIKELFPEDSDQLITLLNKQEQPVNKQDQLSNKQEQPLNTQEQPVNKRRQSRLRRLGSVFRKKST